MSVQLLDQVFASKQIAEVPDVKAFGKICIFRYCIDIPYGNVLHLADMLIS
jgi:hypothetical protein